ncbi:Vitamin K epoxide reductase family protein [Botrimarina hoheduenensis]|uniref:Vitamin K epoxide reductase family protein n=2 Tax=Botrimarina hoheduenensis TaxID=2528000 RepID=A0A5C5VSL3_9BACT|nr:Vitamin K epoxide reductase family protein [Botrimarina hoheduenensis]
MPLDSRLLWGARCLLVTALGLSIYLIIAGAQAGAVAGCDFFSAFDCEAALASRWAKWWGAPVAALGAGTYLLLLAATALIGRHNAAAAMGWRLVEGLGFAAVGAACWFVGVQATALDSFCIYCLATHACGVLAVTGLFVLRGYRSADAAPTGAALLGKPVSAPLAGSPPALGAPTLLGVLAVAGLALGQLFGPVSEGPPATEFTAPEDLQVTGFDRPPAAKATPADDSAFPLTSPDDSNGPSSASENKESASELSSYRRPGGSRKVAFLNNRLSIEAYEHPVLGSPEAPHMVLELMDYACPHCREFHELLTEALAQRDGQIAVIVMPVPGEVLCNPYVARGAKERRGACKLAKLSLAVSELAPESFEPMHRWLLEGDRLPKYTAALLEARRFVDADALSLKLRDESGQLDQRLKRHIELFATLNSIKRIGLPTQVIGNNVAGGGIKTTEQLLEFWDREFGLTLKDSPDETSL